MHAGAIDRVHYYPSPVTTDVQSVRICLVGGTDYSIQCGYLNGSDASGCGYTLVGGVLNMTGTILGRNSSGIVRVADISLYSEVVAYGRELAVPIDATLFVRVNIGIVESCPAGRLQF